MKKRLFLSICLFFTVTAAVLSQTGKPLPTVADLKITFTGGMSYASPGEKLDLEVAVFQVNGNVMRHDVKVELVLVSKRSYKIPAPSSVYNSELSEGVLLKGGKSFYTVPAAGMVTKSLSGTLPADLPAGKYYVAAVVDAGNEIAEWDEFNNVDYCAIQVRESSPQPAEVVFKEMADVLKGHEVYFTGKSDNKGKIFQVHENVGYGTISTVYWPKAIEAACIAFSPTELAYFVDASKYDIYRTDGKIEEKIFSHNTYVRDVVFDRKGQLYFSEATGAGGDGIIYKLDVITKRATKYLTVPIKQTGGFWAGDFAFSPSNQLFISEGNHIPASLYKFENGNFQKVYTNTADCIRGFWFLNENEILFSSQDNNLYFLRNFSEKATALKDSGIDRIRDVWLLDKPATGTESITASFQGGEGVWSLTYVHLSGPNLYWRNQEGYSKKVSERGFVTFTNLPKGRYYLYSDIRADLGWGFRPRNQEVTCNGTPVRVAFHEPVKGVDF